jgi:hypothetical protein
MSAFSGTRLRHSARMRHLRVKLGGLPAGDILLAEDASQGQQVLLDHVDVLALAVLEVHVEMHGGGDLAQLLVMVGLDRGHQHQIGLERMDVLQVRLHDGAQVGMPASSL